MSDPKLNLEEIDVKRLQNLHREYQQNYDAKVNHMTQQFRKCMDELKRDHEKQMSELNTLQNRVIKNHESVNRFHDESLRAVVDEKQEIVNERQKLQLEQKKLNKMKLTGQEISATEPVAQGNGAANTNVVYMQKHISTTSSQNRENKKTAKDFYFKKGQSSNAQKAERKDDFLMRQPSPEKGYGAYSARNGSNNASPINNQKQHRISLQKKSKSPIKQQTFTYDKVSDNGQQDEQASPQKWSQKKKAAQHYIKPKNTDSPNRGSDRKSQTISPHKAYVPPALAATKQSQPSQARSNMNPDIPQSLVDEFKTEPKNYQIMDALHNPDHFNQTLKKWRELGILFAEDIIKNSSSPIDYHLRVSENDIQSAFGQVDKNGKLQGIGREVYDFVYEGQFKDNVYHGWGRYINHLGVYWGNFEKGMRHGRGKFLANNGQSQDGNWNNGQLK